MLIYESRLNNKLTGIYLIPKDTENLTGVLSQLTSKFQIFPVNISIFDDINKDVKINVVVPNGILKEIHMKELRSLSYNIFEEERNIYVNASVFKELNIEDKVRDCVLNKLRDNFPETNINFVYTKTVGEYTICKMPEIERFMLVYNKEIYCFL